jgi:hypothetical protein
MSLMAPDEARRRILAAATRVTGSEGVPLSQAHGRTLASDLVALRTQPPFAASAMDGYAVRAGDLAIGYPLRVIGEAAAGHPFSGTLGDGEAVRIDVVWRNRSVEQNRFNTTVPLILERGPRKPGTHCRASSGSAAIGATSARAIRTSIADSVAGMGN